jgi:hypothetical protein
MRREELAFILMHSINMKINLCKSKRIFRGFCKTNEGNEFVTLNGELIQGKWVYGAPLTKWDPYMPGISQSFIISDNNETGIADWHQVIWETIGMYTGVQNFYEDDIVEFEGKYGVVKYENGSMFVSWLQGMHEPTFCMMIEEYPDIHVVANIWQQGDVFNIVIE